MRARKGMQQRIDCKIAISATVLSIIMLLAVSPVASYGGDGNLTLAAPPPPNTGVCNDDDTDNDGDGLADAADPGCTKLFAYDRSEYDMRDSDLSYNLYDNTPPSSDDLTPLVPGFTKPNYLSSDPDAAGSGQNEIWEAYLDQLGYAQWAGGEIKWERMAPTGTVTGTPSFRPGSAVTNDPVSEGFPLDDSGVETCGNGDREMDEGDNFGCPEDFGFPDDLRTSSGSRTQDQSISDISSELDDFEVSVGIAHSNPLQQEDNPDYTMDFVGTENEGEFKYNIRSPGGSSHTPPRDEEVIEHQGIENAPDFYASGRTLRKIWPEAEETEIGTVDDTDLVVETGITDRVESTESVDTDCNFVGNYSCGTDVDGGPCKSRNSNKVRNYSLREDTKKLEQKTYEYKIENTDDSSGEWQGPGYRDAKEELDGITVKVTRDLENGYTTHNARSCTDHWDEAECESTGPNHGGYCYETSETKTVYDKEPIDLAGMPEGESYTSTETGTTSIKYEDISYEKADIFSTVYEDNKGMETDKNSIEVLFNYDYSPSQVDNILYKDQFYSYEQDIPTRDFSNSPAYSASSFEIVVQDNKFHSKRDYYSVWNVDGTNGFGDSYVAIKEGEIKNHPDPFLNETSIVAGSGGNPGYIEAGDNIDFVTPDDYSPPSCPSDSIFCVSTADVTVKPWDDWDSGSSPEFEIETIDTVNVSESWGACRKYQELLEDVRDTILRCQYDWDDDFPSGPTPFWEPPVVGGEGER